MLKLRLLSGGCLIVLAFIIFALDGALEAISGFPGLILLAIAPVIFGITAFEFSGIIRSAGGDANPVVIAVTSLLMALLIYGGAEPIVITTALLLGFASTLILHVQGGRIDGAIAVSSGTMLGIAYLGVFASAFLLIRNEHSTWMVLGTVLLIKSSDIGAYFTGKAFGKNKLIPWLSPGKTWEGVFGGIAVSMIFAVLLGVVANDTAGFATVYAHDGEEIVGVARTYNLVGMMLVGLAVAIVSLLGDLTMSLFKRDARQKDSGQLFPGMGGILDVFDSPLIAAPAAYWLLKLAAVPIS